VSAEARVPGSTACLPEERHLQRGCQTGCAPTKPPPALRRRGSTATKVALCTSEFAACAWNGRLQGGFLTARVESTGAVGSLAPTAASPGTRDHQNRLPRALRRRALARSGSPKNGPARRLLRAIAPRRSAGGALDAAKVDPQPTSKTPAGHARDAAKRSGRQRHDDGPAGVAVLWTRASAVLPHEASSKTRESNTADHCR